MVLITGASRGVGAGLARFYSKLGNDLILTYHSNYCDLVNLKNELENEYNIKVIIYMLDISDENSIKYMYEDIIKNNYKIDILINNACVCIDNYCLEIDTNDFKKVIDTNLIGTYNMIKYFNKIVNSIVNISSTDGVDTYNKYNMDYSISKCGINLMTKILCDEINCKLLTIVPNFIDTETIKEMDEEFLNSELKRVKQDKLISVNRVCNVINDCLNSDIKSGSLIRIDGDDCEFRIID